MTTSKTIASLLGPTLMAMGATVLLHLRLLPDIVAGFVHDPAIVVAAGFAVFVPGLAIVRFHNYWHRDWRLLVTLVGWMFILVGLARILFPVEMLLIAVQLIQVPGLLPAMALIFLALGGFLTFEAYHRG